MEPGRTDPTQRDALTRRLAWLSFALLPLPVILILRKAPFGYAVVAGLMQLGLSWTAGIRLFAASKRQGQELSAGKVVGGIVLILVGLAGPALGFMGLVLSALGSAWGRPLRVRGRQLHPELRQGADWTAGLRPDPRGLDLPTRRALEALWLHDAQKEHASVPAFSRVSWLLAAVGAPAELLVWAHRAGLEEIDHAQRCFALAAGYGGRTHTVEPMPDLLLDGTSPFAGGRRGDPRVLLALESLRDGCLLEDYNADVAAACAAVCREPATREVLQQIAREERSHADFSWAVLAWTLAAGGEPVRRALQAELGRLEGVLRPSAVSADKAALVAAADPALLRDHGRLPDEEWGRLWTARLQATRERVQAQLAPPAPAPVLAAA
jgi:hypothetical protein